MVRKLNTTVHVVELDDGGDPTGRSGVFGPDDELPGWAAKSITNPDVWANADEPDTEQPAAGGADVAEPPRGGPGSGVDAWAAYARGCGVTVTEGMTREDIIAAVDAAKGQ